MEFIRHQTQTKRVLSDLIEYSSYIDRVVIAKYISANNTQNKTFEQNDPLQYVDLADFPNANDSYKKLLEEVAVLTNAPLFPSDPKNKMLLVNDIWNDVVNKNVILKDVRFNSIWLQSKGGAGKSAAVTNEFIKNSLQTVNLAFPQAQFKYSPHITFQPNWFYPVIRMNGNNVFGAERTNEDFGIAHKGLFGFGYDLPLNMDITKRQETLNTLDVYASCYNAIEFEDGIKYQRYPVSAELTIIVLK